MGRATQDLRKEHDSILRVLSIVDRMMSDKTKEDIIKLKYYNELIYFLKIFVNKCHHGKEENYLFKELIRNGLSNGDGPVGVMLMEHGQGRDLIDMMSRSLGSKNMMGFTASAAKYRDLLTKHMAKENDGLFATADQMLNEAKQEELFEGFKQHEENVIGHGVHERLHAMIDNWDGIFGTDPGTGDAI